MDSQSSAVLGAIDTGSNAIRMVVANAASSNEIEIQEVERVPIRLGHHTFTHGELDRKTIEATVGAYARFRKRFDEWGVTRYRAVATSALRNASNREDLLDRIYREVGIEVEVIDGQEEARLVRKAVTSRFAGGPQPTMIVDLGGGSLEITARTEEEWQASSMRIGTVRLMETFGLFGEMSADEMRMIRRFVRSSLQQTMLGSPGTTLVAACGGNAEALALLCGKKSDDGMLSFRSKALEELIPELAEMTVEERMEAYGVKRDRAEVIAVAALVFATVAETYKIKRFTVPGVGIREGVLLDLAEISVGSLAPSGEPHVVAMARTFAARLGHNTTHGEQVRRIASSLFSQLQELHALPKDMDLVLQLAALLHDVGEVVHRRSHHKHAEYLIMNGRIPGLESPLREMVAAVARGHRKSPPGSKYPSFAQLDSDQRAAVRTLAAILRVADELDRDHRQRVIAIGSEIHNDHIALNVSVASDGARIHTVDLFKTELFGRMFDKDVRCTVSEVATSRQRPLTAE